VCAGRFPAHAPRCYEQQYGSAWHTQTSAPLMHAHSHTKPGPLPTHAGTIKCRDSPRTSSWG
jgi:hypothetical protein